jgi:branched-chain amino acid transport system substrate-binding protein
MDSPSRPTPFPKSAMARLPLAANSRSTRIYFLFALTLIAATYSLALSGCNSAKNGSEIVLGHYATLTGSEATFGRSTDNGIQLAVDEINKAGGINGLKVRVITYDDKGEKPEAGTAVTRLVTKDNVVAVLGEVASSLSLAGAPVCQEYGIPMVTPSSTNEAVTEVGEMIFRVCYVDSFQGYVCAKFAREGLKANKAALLFDQTQAYAVGLQDAFAKAFTQQGGEIVSKQSYGRGDPDFSAQLTAIRGTQPDVIFIPGYYTDVGNIAIQARKLGINAPLLGGDGWDSEKLAEIGGDAINGSYYSNHYSPQDPDPHVQDFIKTYSARFNGTPDGLAALGYDAAKILCQAIEKAGSTEGEKIAAELAKTTDFAGVTGKISIDAKRDAVKPAVILEMKNGVPTYVTTIQPPSSGEQGAPSSAQGAAGK